MMGGRIAEAIKFGDITAGASNDIQRATELARKMVTEWGMSEKLGFANYGKGSEVFLGRDYQTQVTYSEQTAGVIDDEIKKILDENYARAYKLLEENKDKLEQMAHLLLERETIYSKEVDEIMAGKEYKDIIKRINREEKARKSKAEKMRKEEELLRAEQMQLLKEKAATELNAAGVISNKELEAIKEETRKIRAELEFERNKEALKKQSKTKKEETKEEPEQKVEEKPEESEQKEDKKDNE